MRRLAPMSLATAMLVLAGCGGTAADTAASGTAGQSDVEIVDFAFEPGTVEVAVGAEVTWVNRDDFAHTVTSGRRDEPTGSFDGQLGETSTHANAGATFATSFDQPGTYAYFCSLHPSMIGEIVVTGS